MLSKRILQFDARLLATWSGKKTQVFHFDEITTAGNFIVVFLGSRGENNVNLDAMKSKNISSDFGIDLFCLLDFKITAGIVEFNARCLHSLLLSQHLHKGRKRLARLRWNLKKCSYFVSSVNRNKFKRFKTPVWKAIIVYHFESAM